MDALRIIAITNGIPELVRLFDFQKSYAENLRLLFTQDSAYFRYAESELRRSFRTPETYNILLYGMATGHNRISQLSELSSFPQNKCDKYLKALDKAGLLETEQRKDTAGHIRTHYYPKGGYWKTWFRYVFPSQGRYLRAQEGEVLQQLADEIDKTIVAEYFKKVCWNWLEKNYHSCYWDGLLKFDDPKQRDVMVNGVRFDYVQETKNHAIYVKIWNNIREGFPKEAFQKMEAATTLVRAYGLEKALGTPAHIYFKNESVSPIGSHKLNSALAQAYYCKKEGVTNITTETGAGQWGAALSYAAKVFGLEAAVYQVKISYEQKPYRRSIMQTFGAQVTPSPSMSTRAGKNILTKYPNHQGSLGTAISEAIELARTTPNCKYTLGSVLSHVTLHQTVIGLEAEKQMEMAGEYPDMIIGCFGGGSNFGGICFPFMRHTILEGKKTRYIAAEPASCPKLTRGKFEYDFGDEAGYTPLLPMFTLGHNFTPANIHAGGLRYHGAGVIVSQLLKDNLMEAVDIQQLDTFKAGCLFARAEGIIPAPESCHAIAAAIQEAEKCKETGEEKVILFNLSGHGLIDMSAYDQYLSGNLTNYSLSEEDIANSLQDVPQV